MNATNLTQVQVNAANVPVNGAVAIAVQVLASAKVGTLTFAASGIGTTPTTIELTGNLGTEQLSFAASARMAAHLFALPRMRLRGDSLSLCR